MIRVLLADNQSIFRAGILRVLQAEHGFSVLGQCSAAPELLPLLSATRGGVLVLAASMGADMDRTMEATHAQGIRLVLMTESKSEIPGSWLRRIDGLLTRQASAADLLECLRCVSRGERQVKTPDSATGDTVGRKLRDRLNQRELRIVGLVVQGWKNRQIAEELGTKEQVVKNYLRIIYDKTGASDRLELALFTLHHRVLADAATRAAEESASAAAATHS